MTSASLSKPPSKLLLLGEGRALWEAASTLALWPVLQLSPKGDGHTVLVLPGLGAADSSTKLLRSFLEGRGYVVHGWGLGTNFGPRPGLEKKLNDLLKELSATGAVSVVGWSLGGVFARMLAVQHPKSVRSVITLGTPFKGPPLATNATKVYELLSGKSASDTRRMSMVRQSLQVPTTSIFSRTDGIVSWRSSLEIETSMSENIEVVASHVGLGVHPAVYYAIADRLSKGQGQWTKFVAPPLLRAFYPDPAC